MQWIAILLLSIACCISYGIIHDQITARICVEYFTIGHPPVFQTQDPTWLGLGWGVLATWWVGVLLGVPLAAVSRMGKAPQRSARDLVRPMLILMGCCGAFAFVIGVTGYVAARNGWVFLIGQMAISVPLDKHVAFLTDLWAHNAAYLAGFAGGVVLLVRVWRSRYKSKK